MYSCTLLYSVHTQKSIVKVCQCLNFPKDDLMPALNVQLWILDFFFRSGFLSAKIEFFSRMAAALKSSFFEVTRPFEELSNAPLHGQNGQADPELLLCNASCAFY